MSSEEFIELANRAEKLLKEISEKLLELRKLHEEDSKLMNNKQELQLLLSLLENGDDERLTSPPEKREYYGNWMEWTIPVGKNGAIMITMHEGDYNEMLELAGELSYSVGAESIDE